MTRSLRGRWRDDIDRHLAYAHLAFIVGRYSVGALRGNYPEDAEFMRQLSLSLIDRTVEEISRR